MGTAKPVPELWDQAQTPSEPSRADDVPRTSDRVRYADTVPYETPASLAALRGPGSGYLELPLAIYWGPHRAFDLDDRGERHAAYRAIIRVGSSAEQARLLHRGLLLDEWDALILPDRCRALWETAHAELRTESGEGSRSRVH